MLAGELGHQLFARGEAVCRQGDPGSSFYLIRSGSISVSVKGPDGADTEVAKLGPGQYFGEMSLLTGDSRSSTCRALEDAELLCLDRETFAVLLKDNPPVAQAMSDILAARASATQEKLNERETLVRKRDGEHEKRADTILQRIRGIFGFKRQP
jgi:CRP-like cAMP-binding protein